MAYKTTDICQVYKIDSAGSGSFTATWFDSLTSPLPRLTAFAYNNETLFSEATTAAFIVFRLNEQLDEDIKFHFHNEGPFIIIRKNSDDVVSLAECNNMRMEFTGIEVSAQEVSLDEEIPLIWVEETDPALSYFDSAVLTNSRGTKVIMTVKSSGVHLIDDTNRTLGDTYNIVNSLNSEFHIDISLDSVLLSGYNELRTIRMNPGDAIRLVFGDSWLVVLGSALQGKFIKLFFDVDDSLLLIDHFNSKTINSSTTSIVEMTNSTPSVQKSFVFRLDNTGPHIPGQIFAFLNNSDASSNAFLKIENRILGFDENNNPLTRQSFNIPPQGQKTFRWTGIDWYDFTDNETTPPIWITDAGTLGTFVSASAVSVTPNIVDYDASPSPISFSLVSGALPPGLSLNSGTGEISGIAGTVVSVTVYNFVIDADDGLEFRYRAFSITLTT